MQQTRKSGFLELLLNKTRYKKYGIYNFLIFLGSRFVSPKDCLYRQENILRLSHSKASNYFC